MLHTIHRVKQRTRGERRGRCLHVRREDTPAVPVSLVIVNELPDLASDLWWGLGDLLRAGRFMQVPVQVKTASTHYDRYFATRENVLCTHKHRERDNTSTEGKKHHAWRHERGHHLAANAFVPSPTEELTYVCGFVCLLPELEGTVGLVGRNQVDEVVRNSLTLKSAHFVRANVHPFVHLHGIGRDDLAVEALR
jgi:hypothetical protein